MKLNVMFFARYREALGLDGEAGSDDDIGNWNMDQKKGNE